MLVCHCKAVFERQVREVIAAGAQDAFDVALACGAGTGCGGCVPTVTCLLREVLGDGLARLRATEPTWTHGASGHYAD